MPGHRSLATIGQVNRLSPLERMALAHFRRSVEAIAGDRLAAFLVFGSRARGEGRADSDVDVCVAIRDLARDERSSIIDASADVSVDHGLVLSPLIIDAARLSGDEPIFREVRKDGFAP